MEGVDIDGTQSEVLLSIECGVDGTKAFVCFTHAMGDLNPLD